jgi:hypothetical protein
LAAEFANRDKDFIYAPSGRFDFCWTLRSLFAVRYWTGCGDWRKTEVRREG